MNPATDTHPVTADCRDLHCTWHNVDEPETGYIVCMECGHCFLTEGHLVEADYEAQRVAQEFDPDDMPKPKRRAASSIDFCPFCAHWF